MGFSKKLFHRSEVYGHCSKPRCVAGRDHDGKCTTSFSRGEVVHVHNLTDKQIPPFAVNFYKLVKSDPPSAPSAVSHLPKDHCLKRIARFMALTGWPIDNAIVKKFCAALPYHKQSVLNQYKTYKADS